MLAEETPTETIAGLEHAGVHKDALVQAVPQTQITSQAPAGWWSFPWDAACSWHKGTEQHRCEAGSTAQLWIPLLQQQKTKIDASFTTCKPSSSFFSSKPLPTPLDLSEMFTHLPHPQDLACSIAVYEFAWQPDINIQPTSKQSLACSELQCFCAQPYNKSELATRQGINPLSLAQSII